MLTNLFSVFDPSSSVSLVSNWVVVGCLMVFLPLCKWSSGTRMVSSSKVILENVSAEASVLLPNKSKGSIIIFITLFSFLFLSNTFGLLPYIFTSTAHLSVSLSLALPIWLGFYLSGWVYSSGSMLAHLVPLGTPAGLMPFMVIIESISSMIRPITLAVRLAANMIAGHLLLTLMGSTISITSFFSSGAIISSQVLLVVLEVAVAMIQAYVFTILVTLYMGEV